jgi:hypothetical protein
MLRKTLIAVIVLLFSALVFAQQQPASKDDPSSSGGMMGMNQNMMQSNSMQNHNPSTDCQNGIQMRHQMMNYNSEADKKLDAMIDRMNKAKGNDKIQAMSAVINELAAQRRSFRQMMMYQQPMMTGSMMGCQNWQNMMMGNGMMHQQGANTDMPSRHPEQ